MKQEVKDSKKQTGVKKQPEQPVEAQKVEERQDLSHQRWSTKLLAGIAGITLVLGFVVGVRFPAIWNEVRPFFGFQRSVALDFEPLQELYDQLSWNFDGHLDRQRLIEGAMRGLVQAAGDPYTAFLTPEENRQFQASLQGDVGAGIGVEIGVRDGRVLILRTLPDNPAGRAGIQQRDEIIAVNGRDVEGQDADIVAGLVRGAAGSNVTITVRRGDRELDFTMTRERINNVSVISEFRDDVAIITMYRFDRETPRLMNEAAQQAQARNIRNVVLDLRGNGGGYVQVTQEVAGLWLASQVILTERSMTGDRTFRSTGTNQILAGRNTVVLINGGTASASEILAAALRDHRAATLIGESTFGKGSMQSQVALRNGGLLRVTTARWLTPNGVDLSRNGLTPDIEVEMTLDDINALRDPQLDAAIRHLTQ
ncbi:S41 family peptidase [Candidatus Saccharibacteria bacterium]|nr:S41 family peptidase [Candidatus Saccharibacteria bacterium]